MHLRFDNFLHTIKEDKQINFALIQKPGTILYKTTKSVLYQALIL